MEFTQDHVTVNGCKLFVRRGGRGAPLLFLHGANGPDVSAPFMNLLAKQFDVIAPDHPGFGSSDTPDWIETVGDMAYFYLDFLKAMQLREVHLVGNSLGGWIAAEMAVRSTDRLKTVTLASAVGIHVEGITRPDIFLMNPRQLAETIFADPELAKKRNANPPTEQEAATLMKNRFMTAKLSWQPRSHNPDLPKWLHRIDVPSLILWGDSDRLVPLAFGEEYHRLIPASRLEVLRRCGHLPQVERSAEFVDRVAQFALAA
jgi:pimeloyl-ACP methyl ester carboxylesterase